MISKEDVRAAAIEIFESYTKPLREKSSYKIKSETLASVLRFLQHEYNTADWSDEVGTLDGTRHDLAKALPEVRSRFEGFETNKQETRAIVVQVWLTRNICDLASFLARCARTGYPTNSTEEDREDMKQIFRLGAELSVGRGALRIWCLDMASDLSHYENGYLGHEPRYDKFEWDDFTRASEEYAMAKKARSEMSVESDGDTASEMLSSRTEHSLLQELWTRSSQPDSFFPPEAVATLTLAFGSKIMW
jgi:hypothetical protein